MRTRSSSNLIVESSTILKRRNRRRSKQIVEPELRTIVETLVATMADTRTMSELLQAPTEGYGDAIVLPPILTENFELKTTNLKNDITNFQQRFDETFSEAWDRFKDLLRKCLHHSFSELHQIDTFYNALTQSNQDSLNAAAGGNLLNRTPRDALTIIENKSKVHTSRNTPVVSKVSDTSSSTPAYLPEITTLTDAVKVMLLQNKTPSPAPVKAIEEICVTCGGPHPHYKCLATDGNTFNASAATWTYNQGGPEYRRNQNYQAPLNQTQVGPSNDFSNYMKTNDINMRAMQNQISNMKTELKNEFQTTMKNQNNELKNMMSSFFQMQSPSGSGSLPSNTIANPRGDLKDITTRSGVSYDGPTILTTSSPLLKEVEREPKVTKDKVQTTNLGSTAHVQPLVVQVPTPEPDVAPKPNPKPSIPYPSRLNDQKLKEKANNQMLKFLQIFQRLHFDHSFVDDLLHIPKFASTFRSLLSNKEKLFELANTPLNENYECLALADLGDSINLMPLSIWKKLSLPELTLTHMTLELANRSVAYPVGVAEDVFVKVGKFHFLADFVVVDYDVNPRVTLILERPFLRTTHALVDVFGDELILRDGDEKLIFHADNTSKHPQKHANESINMINFIDITCEDRFPEVLKKSTHPSSGSTTPLSNSLPSLTPFETSDSLLEEFADELTFLDPFPPGIGDADFDSEGDILLLEKLLNDDPLSPLPLKELNFKELKMIKSSIDDSPPLDVLGGNSVTFSNPLFDANDDFTSSNDKSLPEEDVLKENFKIYSNPLFEFNEEYISSSINFLFNEVLEDIENKDSYVSNLDETALLVTPLFDANEDDCFDP
ncbi:reverse transcriptase domain-containing protein [Tanacetum coccineum]